ncbi:hypothetical protein MRX96_001537 [Rhipicephalus microplus]
MSANHPKRQLVAGPEDVRPLEEFETSVANALDPEAIFGISGGMYAPEASFGNPEGPLEDLPHTSVGRVVLFLGRANRRPYRCEQLWL